LILLVNLALRSKFNRPLGDNHTAGIRFGRAQSSVAAARSLPISSSRLRQMAWRIVLQLCADADSLRAAVRTAH
jgi:hypothetical protein